MKKWICILIILVSVLNIRIFKNAEEEKEKTDYSVNHTIEEKQDDKVTEFSKYKDINDEVVCVLSVTGRDISFPVMYKAGDPEYYSDRDIYGKESIYGTSFTAQGNILEDDIVFIYGHYFKTGEIFGFVHYYLEEDYYIAHHVIRIETDDYFRDYSVFAVCELFVRENDGFIYNDSRYFRFETEEEYDEFLEHIESSIAKRYLDNPLYKCKIIALSTCKSYSRESSRRVVLFAYRNQ